MKTNAIIKNIDEENLKRLVADNQIITSNHPDLDLQILNYSPKTQYRKLWNEYTLSCRGLVINSNGDVIARPFKKFFNQSEHSTSDIPSNLMFEVFEKMDGSFGILFNYKDQWIFASRGSFISEQSKVGRKMLSDSVLSKLSKDHTYMFEILYPENRIVVDYGDLRELVMLGKINTKTGEETPYNDLYKAYNGSFKIVKRYDGISDFNMLQELAEDNKEGFVVRFSDGFRMKVKFEEYIRLHRIITNVSNLTVWEHLKNGYDFEELIDRVPDEFYNWLKNTIHIMEKKYLKIETVALKEFINLCVYENISDKKEFAINVLGNSKYPSIMFALFNNKDYSEIIWKQIRPEHSKPFE